jgi:cation diffusion facilitator CzcD-associated flavoprotein CzcO
MLCWNGTGVAQAWRDRWDSFTLVTPNWTLDLPGSPYPGDDPEGHVHRDQIVAYLEKYAAGSVGAPVREGVIIPPDVQRRMAQRAGATISEVAASHVSMISKPQATIDAILAAVAAASD